MALDCDIIEFHSFTVVRGYEVVAMGDRMGVDVDGWVGDRRNRWEAGLRDNRNKGDLRIGVSLCEQEEADPAPALLSSPPLFLSPPFFSPFPSPSSLLSHFTLSCHSVALYPKLTIQPKPFLPASDMVGFWWETAQPALGTKQAEHWVCLASSVGTMALGFCHRLFFGS